MPAKRSWIMLCAAACAVIVGLLAWDWSSALPADALTRATYVGRSTCAECHTTQHDLWLGSHHDRAMELATDTSVLGDFNDTSFTRAGVTTRFFRRDGKFMVNTEGPDGEYHDYEIKYTFGVDPLQQYMVEFPRGRVQVLRVSWDTQKKQWFEVTPPDVPEERILPGDPVHWTGIGQNWNTTCADCHSTNLQKGYNPAEDSYHTTFAEIDVSCEECHGPGSVHTELARGRSLFWDRNVGYGLPRLKSVNPETQLTTCAKCHSHRVQVHEQFRPGQPLLDYYVPSLLTTGLYYPDGQIRQEVYEYGSFLQSKMYAQRVRCTDCHDPHSLKLKAQGNALCTQCHLPGKYDTPAHHHHAAGSTGAQCIECHMPSRLYMVIDSRRDHSFRIPRPDLSAKLDTPNACTNCHTKPTETNEWAAEAIRKWYGDRRPNDPHWAPAFAAGMDRKPEGDNQILDLLKVRTLPTIVRASAIELLGGYADRLSADARRSALNDLSPLVRRTAVTVFPENDPASIASELLLRLEDPLRAVRVAAAVRLAYMPHNNWSSAQLDLFARGLAEYREAQTLSLDHAGGHLAMGGLDRHVGEQMRAAGQPAAAAKFDADSVEHLRSAIRVEPYISGPRGELALMLERRGGEPLEVRRLREEELALLVRDTQLDPDSGEIFYRLAMLHVLLGQLEQATTALEQAGRLLPQDYTSHMALALVYQQRYEQTSDETFFTAAVGQLELLRQISPTDPRAGAILRSLMLLQQAKQRSLPPRDQK